MNIFDMDKNSLPEQVQINKENIKRLMETASINSFALRAAFAESFSELATYTTGALVWHNDSNDDIPEYYLYQANQNVSAGIWDDSQWNAVTLKTLLDQKQDALIFDNAPTENSDNPVKSDGIYNAIKDGLDNLEPVLLWTNPNPASFAAQDISLPTLADYRYIVLEYRYYKDDVNETFFAKGNNNSSIVGQFVDANNYRIVSRIFSFNGVDKCSVATAYTAVLNPPSKSSTTEWLIPINIYGTNHM